MTDKEIKEMRNSELLAHLFITRDNLVSIRRRMYDRPNTSGLVELFDIERNNYDQLTKELFWRMEHGKR